MEKGEGEGKETGVEEGYWEGGGSALLDDEGFQMYSESMWGNTPQAGEGKSSRWSRVAWMRG